MVASGWREPELPFFVFQEYERNLDPNGDPAGQVLAAMLAGQSLNNGAFPIHGCYVVGRDWYFMALDGLDYATTRGHNALDTDEPFDIFRILKALKQIVAERVSKLASSQHATNASVTSNHLRAASVNING